MIIGVEQSQLVYYGIKSPPFLRALGLLPSLWTSLPLFKETKQKPPTPPKCQPPTIIPQHVGPHRGNRDPQNPIAELPIHTITVDDQPKQAVIIIPDDRRRRRLLLEDDDGEGRVTADDGVAV